MLLHNFEGAFFMLYQQNRVPWMCKPYFRRAGEVLAEIKVINTRPDKAMQGFQLHQKQKTSLLQFYSLILIKFVSTSII